MSATNSLNIAKEQDSTEDNYGSFAVKKRATNMAMGLPTAFIFLLAHEIRNPLTNIDLSVKLLELNIGTNEGKEYIDIIKRSCLKINYLVSTFIKAQELKREIQSNQFIQEILNDILEDCADRISLKNILVTKIYSSRDLKISKNTAKLKIALTNIIVNAIDAMPFETGELQIMTKFTNGRYLVYIKDNGCGIKKENLNKIFHPFYTNKSNGLGIGLALSYDIFKLNGVQIKVESEELRGTCFTLSFIDNINS